MVHFRASNNEYYNNGVKLHKYIININKMNRYLPLGTSFIDSSIQVV